MDSLQLIYMSARKIGFWSERAVLDPRTPVRVLMLQSGSGHSGGIATYISELVAASRGQLIHFFVTKEFLPASLGASGRLDDSATARELALSYTGFTLPKVVLQVARLIRRDRIEIIHAHALRAGLVGAIASLFTKVPLIYTNHGLRYRQKTTFISRATFFGVEALVMAFARRTCAIRETDYRLLRSHLPFLRSRVSMICTEVSPPKRSTEDGDRERLLVGVGSLLQIKRPDRFVAWVREASKQAGKLTAIWIGDGVEHSARSVHLSDERSVVQFVGALPRPQVHEQLARASVLLITSEWETFPLVALEAYAHAVPVVCSRFEGVDDFVVDGATGFIVSGDDTLEAADKICTLLNNPLLRAQMGFAARHLYEKRFSDPGRMLRIYQSLYREALGERASMEH